MLERARACDPRPGRAGTDSDDDPHHRRGPAHGPVGAAAGRSPTPSAGGLNRWPSASRTNTRSCGPPSRAGPRPGVWPQSCGPHSTPRVTRCRPTGAIWLRRVCWPSTSTRSWAARAPAWSNWPSWPKSWVVRRPSGRGTPRRSWPAWWRRPVPTGWPSRSCPDWRTAACAPRWSYRRRHPTGRPSRPRDWWPSPAPTVPWWSPASCGPWSTGRSSPTCSLRPPSPTGSAGSCSSGPTPPRCASSRVST